MKIKNYIQIISFTALFIGCSSTKNIYLDNLEDWVGHTKKEITKAWKNKKLGYTTEKETDDLLILSKIDSVPSHPNDPVKDATTHIVTPAPDKPTVYFITRVSFQFDGEKVKSWQVSYSNVPR